MRSAPIVQEHLFRIEKDLILNEAEIGFKWGPKKSAIKITKKVDTVWFSSNCNKLPKTEKKLERQFIAHFNDNFICSNESKGRELLKKSNE